MTKAQWNTPLTSAKSALRALLGLRPYTSSGYRRSSLLRLPRDGWREKSVARYQHENFRGLLDLMYAGKPRRDFLSAAEAVKLTKLKEPTILDVGCGSGYYTEVFSHLVGPLEYCGMDYSSAMVEQATSSYPNESFLVGDACQIPFADGTFDIVFNGGALIHIVDYRTAIVESRRVARHFCVFQTVTTTKSLPTTVLVKRAYGKRVREVIYNQGELLEIFEESGLRLAASLESVTYDLSPVIGEATKSCTFLCKCS